MITKPVTAKDLYPLLVNESKDLFSRYIMSKDSTSSLLGIFQDNGRLIAGIIQSQTLFEAQDAWVIGDADLILNELKNHGHFVNALTKSININLNREPNFSDFPSCLKITRDLRFELYFDQIDTLDAKTIHEEYCGLVGLPLHKDILTTLKMSSEVKNIVGNFNDFKIGSNFFGLIKDSTLLGVVDGFVTFGQKVALQQVYVDTNFREMGIASKLLQFAINELKNKGFNYFIYIASDTNEASIKLAVKLGFKEQGAILNFSHDEKCDH